MDSLKKALSPLIRPLGSLLILAIFLLHAIGYWNIGLFSKLEQIAYDVRINMTLPNEGDSQILIIDIDEDSLREIGQFPWPREYIAELLYILFGEYGISTLGFDIVFPEADQRGATEALKGLLLEKPELTETLTPLIESMDGDRQLAGILNQTPAVLGFYLDREPEIETPSVGVLPEPLPIKSPISPSLLPIPKAQRFSGNQPVHQANALSAGFFDNPLVDQDGVFRRVPMIQEYQGNYYQSLSLAVVRSVLGMPPVEFIISGNKNNPTLEALDVGGFRIPVDNQTGALVPYYGGRGTFEYISVTDIFQQTAAKEKLQGAIVLLGTSAPGLLDLRTTPVQSVYAGVEVHANLIAGILHQSFKHQPSYTVGGEILLLIFLGLLLTFTLPRLNPLPILIGSVLIFSGIWYGNLLLWTDYKWVFPLATPVLLSALIIAYQLAYGYLVESRGKRQLTRLFGQYVPPELVDEMNENPASISLEGESREMTVLFSDVRGFTTISEGLNPEELTRLMNAFLTPMTGVIHEYRGTIDKYMGDAIMAFWGAPLKDPLHAKHGVEAGLRMIEIMKELGPEFKKRGWPELKIGVGLNTGPMNVGNMGSEFRMAYTVLGDAVNLGSRLEGLTKQYGVDLMVSETTAAAADNYLYRELDLVKVKGKHEPVAIFEPVALKGSLSEAELNTLDRYHQTLKHFRNQDWGYAERLLSELLSEEKRMIYDVYLDRINLYREQPPGKDWDGVFTHTSK
ncbi:CHASE2 domain-containing protein [Oceanospirillum linum]|uniref:CHASE2 domain-containing protein n=1 Tax=Oceanospirillum linum TaxID=966 RepID=UPI00089E4B5D|nr:adenylate/guanylate cyclase domain-containing protein [Oceanospirillum linum]SEG33538.1 adenylate cyclase [Oleiphilus messinensis]SMP29349.1 adenylate cyclase [Oceanospirillum linum]